MIRWIMAFVMLAQTVGAQVTVDPERVFVRDGWWTLELELGLSAVTPYRAFTLDDPRRLVVDFQDVAFDQIDPADILSGDRAMAVRFGPLRPGWSRMVVDLAEPLVIAQAAMEVTAQGADLKIVLEQADEDAFAARAGAPPDPGWDAAMTFDPAVDAALAKDDQFTVVLDPGHGGIDPGAHQGGIKESDLMLLLAQEAAGALHAIDGVRVVLTRDDDHFLPLSARLTFARQVGADLFISLHADALADPDVQGASVYTLSTGGTAAADRRSVERHERGDLLSGVDLSDAEDRVATALMDLARAQTGPASQRFADMLAAAMADEGMRMNNRARREGQFVVLTAAGFPSVLVEAGFLSNPADRAKLATFECRARLVRAIRDSVMLLAH